MSFSAFMSQLPSLHFPIIFITLFFVFLILKISIKTSSNPKNSATLNLPPGPLQLPIIGNLHHLFGHLPQHILRDLANKYGPVMLLQVGELTTIVISSAEAAKQVLKTHDLIFAQRPDLFATNIISYNNKNIGFSPNGPYWRQLRKICSLQLLSVKRVQSFRSIRREEVSKMVSVISSSVGSPVNLSNFISTLTYRIISRATIGKIWNGQEEYQTAMDKILLEIGKGAGLVDVFPSVKFLHVISKLWNNVEKPFKQVDRIFQDILNEHKARKQLARAGSDERNQEDLLDVLLDLQNSGELECALTDDNIKAIIMDIFLGGSDSSATIVEWAMAEMIRNPRVMAKAQAEVRQMLGAKENVDEADLHQLNYLKLVINETLRLRPPAPLLLPRESNEPCVINGYDIPAKSKVLVNAWAIGRDPRYWNDPVKFYPERFLEGDSVDYKKTNFEFIPFGGGRRMCPGISFGMATVELQLAQLLFHFNWKFAAEQNPQNLDMEQQLGVTGRRKHDLYLIPTLN